MGPISKAQLVALVKAGGIKGSTAVRHTSMSAYRPLAEMVRKKPPQAPPPPPPPPPPERREAPAAPLPPPPDPVQPFQFEGTGGAYFRIWIVNTLLSIVTLGIYSAWAKVRRKQFFYSHTRVAGSAFAYLADPIKILKGRIIVFAGFFVYSTVQKFFPPAGLVMTACLAVLLPWFVVRSLAFNSRNSAWRHVRFNFKGTYGQAALVYLLWPLLAVLTLGLLFPYAYYRQRRFVVENSAFGTTTFAFHARARDYYRIWLYFLPALIGAALVAGAVSWLAPAAAPAVIALVAALTYLYALAYFSVTANNLLFNSAGLQHQRFEAAMRVWPYAGIVLTNTMAIVVTLGLFHPFAQVRAYRYKITNLTLLGADGLDRFVADETRETSALGDELSDFLDFDFGL